MAGQQPNQAMVAMAAAMQVRGAGIAGQRVESLVKAGALPPDILARHGLVPVAATPAGRVPAAATTGDGGGRAVPLGRGRRRGGLKEEAGAREMTPPREAGAGEGRPYRKRSNTEDAVPDILAMLASVAAERSACERGLGV